MFAAIRHLLFTIFLILFVFDKISIDSQGLYTLITSKVICDQADPRVVSNYSCITRPINRTAKATNVTIVIAPNVSLNNEYVVIGLRSGTGFRRSIIDKEEDFCGYVGGRVKSFLISILWDLLKKHSNLGHPCPYSGVVYIRDMVVTVDNIPLPYLPEGQVKLIMHVRNGRERISVIRVTFYGEIKPKGAFKLVL